MANIVSEELMSVGVSISTFGELFYIWNTTYNTLLVMDDSRRKKKTVKTLIE